MNNTLMGVNIKSNILNYYIVYNEYDSAVTPYYNIIFCPVVYVIDLYKNDSTISKSLNVNELCIKYLTDIPNKQTIFKHCYPTHSSILFDQVQI